MKYSDSVAGRAADNYIEGFIDSQVTGRGLDERTEKAYRLDLEHLWVWLEKDEELSAAKEKTEGELREQVSRPCLPKDMADWERKIQQYLIYLSQERKLRGSTISRKCRVFSYFLAYLRKQGMLSESTVGATLPKPVSREEETVSEPLSKAEVDSFFGAIRREREELDSDFRRRVCLRDQVMMGLLFYHGIEISELLKLEVSDYDRSEEILKIRKKRGKTYTIQLFSKELRELLGRWIDEHEYFERDNGFQEILFLSKLGKPLSMKMVILIFEKYRQLAGIKKEFTPKDLKNSLGRYGEELVREMS